MRPSLLRLSLLRRTGLVFPLSYWTGKLIAMNIRRILERIITRSVARSECTSALDQGGDNDLEIWGRRGSSSATERHQGFVDAMSIDPNVKIRELDGYWYRKNAYEEVLKLDSIEDVDIVFAHNDMMALGPVRRLRSEIRRW